MQVHEFVANGDGDALKAVLVEQLSSLGFTVDWRDEWTATAVRGSRTKNVLFGAFAPYSRIELAVRSLAGDEDETDLEPADGAGDEADRVEPVHDDLLHVVRLESRASGLLGGVMGMKRTRDGYAELRTSLRAALTEDGSLVEERDPGPSRIA